MEEKCEAEQRAADAIRATSEIRSEMERVRKRADEVIRTSEQETEALRANAVETTAAGILADIDSKYCPTASAGTGPGPTTLEDELVQGLGVDAGTPGRISTCTPGGCKTSLVAEIHRRLDTAYETVRAARALAAAVKSELGRVRGEAAADAEVALHHQRESSAALVAEVQRTARQEATAAAGQVAASEAALRTAKEEMERLRGELRRTQATEAATRAATADDDKSESIRRISQLEDELREANLEHERSRQQSELEIEVLRETLERSEEAGRAARAVQGGYAAAVREDEVTVRARAEDRLETLRASVEEENNQKNGVQVRVSRKTLL